MINRKKGLKEGARSTFLSQKYQEKVVNKYIIPKNNDSSLHYS
jgi:hypothetical protein